MRSIERISRRSWLHRPTLRVLDRIEWPCVAPEGLEGVRRMRPGSKGRATGCGLSGCAGRVASAMPTGTAVPGEWAETPL